VQALQQDFNHLYCTSLCSADLPWDYPEPVLAYSQRLPSTLYGQKFLSVVIDEAQGVRNTGPKHTSALRILDQASVRLILTATPLQTSTKVCRFDSQ
jgi:TATA-binding protein-associated factor